MNKNHSLFSLGFRPFFFVASVFASVAMFTWVVVFAFSTRLPVFDYYSANSWHSHEMVFAYSMAVIAGFLLTAIKNWTGLQTVNGSKLMVLVLVWIIARIAPFVTGIGWIVAILDILFLPLLAIFVALPLVKVGNKRNYFMIALVLIFALMNILFHLDLLDIVDNTLGYALKSTLYLIIALIIVMAGRVFPMFSQNGVANKYQVTKYIWVEKLVVPSYLLFASCLVFINIPILVFLSGLFAAIVHLLRLKGWYNSQIWQIPLVWILHLGYFFIIIGLVLTSASVYYPYVGFLALHSFSVGVIGVITIGMMARVSVGHTGRDLRNPPKIIVPAFVLIILATIIRVFVPIVSPELYRMVIISSGLLWAVAFLLFSFVYANIWLKPRVEK